MTSIDNLHSLPLSLSLSLFFSHRNLGHSLLNSRPTIYTRTLQQPPTPSLQKKNKTLLIVSPVLLVLPLIFKVFIILFFCNLTNPSFKKDKQLAPIPDPDPTLSQSDPSTSLNLSLSRVFVASERGSLQHSGNKLFYVGTQIGRLCEDIVVVGLV